MDFDDTPDEAAYRARVRELLEQHAGRVCCTCGPGEEAADARSHEAELRRTQRVLAEAGLVGVTWPPRVRRPGRHPGAAGDRRPGAGPSPGARR